MLPEFSPVWAESLSLANSNAAFREFPHFPNPHIRSNAFLVKRDDLLAIPLEDKGKMAACRFESGKEGLSMHLLRQGLDILVVGADGKSDTIWTSGQIQDASAPATNPIFWFPTIRRRSTTHFQKVSERYIGFSAGGGYSSEFPHNITLYDTPYAKTTALNERVNDLFPPKTAGRQRFFFDSDSTHNRLDLVLDAIKTVTNQNYDNWEIVVFDNASKEPIADAIRALDDERIRCERSDDFLPVTGSWNRAINMARGEYVTMVGDDDGIAPGYFERLNDLADRFDDPDLVISNLYQFMHPGVVPGKRQGYVNAMPMADFLVDRDCAFVVDKQTVKRSVDNSLGMRRSFMFNMPAFCCGKKLLDKMRIGGNVLDSPFPDYYFANLAMHLADRVVGEPRCLAFQGVSKVSFRIYHDK
ncbi:glycosyltransferase family A protein [Rhizobium beringeri]